MNTHKGDRRKTMIAASNELKGNVEYFNKLGKCIDHVNYIKSFYEYSKGISDMDKFNYIPLLITEYQKLLCELSISPIEAFIKDMVADCEDVERIMTTKQLFEEFNYYLDKS